MTQAELIDRLCTVTTALSNIVREQASIIEQARLVNEEVAAQREAAENELDLLELAMRPIHGTGAGKEQT